jgi:hypothetical protein
MANTKISHLGGREIAMSGKGESYKSALGDGTSKPGDLVYYVDATGYATYATTALFTGILDNDYKTAEDTAITAAQPCTIIKPTSGHIYKVKFSDAGGAKPTGTPLIHNTGTGAVQFGGDDTKDVLGYLEQPIADDDTVCLMRWK